MTTSKTIAIAITILTLTSFFFSGTTNALTENLGGRDYEFKDSQFVKCISQNLGGGLKLSKSIHPEQREVLKSITQLTCYNS